MDGLFGEFDRALPVDWLVEDWIKRDDIFGLLGKPKTFKSFAMLDLCLCVASGRTWHGSTVTKGKVLFVEGRGNAGLLGIRLKAWCDHTGVDPSTLADFSFVAERPIQLGSGRVKDLIAAIDDKYDLIALDLSTPFDLGTGDLSKWSADIHESIGALRSKFTQAIGLTFGSFDPPEEAARALGLGTTIAVKGHASGGAMTLSKLGTSKQLKKKLSAVLVELDDEHSSLALVDA